MRCVSQSYLLEVQRVALHLGHQEGVAVDVLRVQVSKRALQPRVAVGESHDAGEHLAEQTHELVRLALDHGQHLGIGERQRPTDRGVDHHGAHLGRDP